MGKQASAFDLALGHPPTGVPPSRWLYTELKSAILQGKLPAGTRVPSTRAVAQACRLARGTVVGAFELLSAEGYLRGATGSGTWVAPLHSAPEVRERAGDGQTNNGGGHLAQRSRPFQDFHFATPGRHIDTSLFPFYPALDLFPLALWRRIALRRMRQFDASSMVNQHPLGYLPLREAIADYLHLARGISCSAAQIAIVSGVQQALDLVSRLVTDPGDAAVVEDPCYPGAVALLGAAGLRVEAVPVDDQGIQIQPETAPGARLAFVTPAHQAPLGAIMSAQRRMELLEWAQRNDALIFEDDYDSEFRYSGWPVPALASREGGGRGSDRVVTFGAFTKTLFPSLRIGYVVLPRWLLVPFESAMAITARYQEPALQQVLFDFIVQGHYARHIQRMRTRYARRREILSAAVEAALSQHIRIEAPGEGLATIGWLRGANAARVAALAPEHSLMLVPLSRFVVAQRRSEALVLGFANTSESNLDSLMTRLSQVLIAASH
jgi:GntR family transcriptional regulator/MocR family aminotransferase